MPRFVTARIYAHAKHLRRIHHDFTPRNEPPRVSRSGSSKRAVLLLEAGSNVVGNPLRSALLVVVHDLGGSTGNEKLAGRRVHLVLHLEVLPPDPYDPDVYGESVRVEDALLVADRELREDVVDVVEPLTAYDIAPVCGSRFFEVDEGLGMVRVPPDVDVAKADLYGVREAKFTAHPQPFFMSGTRVIVVGGGAIGCSVARALQDVGASVHLFEANECGGGATWAAAGMLSPYAEVGSPGPLLDFAVASLAAYPEFVERLESETGMNLRFDRTGKLEVALSDERAAVLADMESRFADLSVEAMGLTPAEVVDLEPALAAAPLVAGLLFSNDAHVDNRALGLALARSATKSGVEIEEGAPVVSIEERSGGTMSVRLESGSQFDADLVVLAAGSRAGTIHGLPHALPMVPVLGEMISYRRHDVIRRMVHTDDVYLIQRGSRVLVGATMETLPSTELGETISRDGRTTLAEGASRALGDLPGAPFEHWAGVRPGTPDGRPLLGTDPDMPGLAYACGHFRNGILLTPATAAWAPSLLDAPTAAALDAVDLSVFAYSSERFGL